jgi:hypothetical protein
MAYDMAVVKTAYTTALSMDASSKVLLALFEAAIVESNFQNLSGGDRDSVGFLQQRPSQGWPNPMDVATATRSFVAKAKPLENKYPTAGLLAQAVQVSAFPLKYDAVKLPASELIAGLAVSGGIGSGLSPNTGNPFATIQKAIATLTDSTMWMRIGLFGVGGVLVVLALMKLTGTSSYVTGAVKTAAKVAAI